MRDPPGLVIESGGGDLGPRAPTLAGGARVRLFRACPRLPLLVIGTAQHALTPPLPMTTHRGSGRQKVGRGIDQQKSWGGRRRCGQVHGDAARPRRLKRSPRVGVQGSDGVATVGDLDPPALGGGHSRMPPSEGAS